MSFWSNYQWIIQKCVDGKGSMYCIWCIHDSSWFGKHNNAVLNDMRQCVISSLTVGNHTMDTFASILFKVWTNRHQSNFIFLLRLLSFYLNMFCVVIFVHVLLRASAQKAHANVLVIQGEAFVQTYVLL
jgi:hypothetical protein